MSWWKLNTFIISLYTLDISFICSDTQRMNELGWGMLGFSPLNIECLGANINRHFLMVLKGRAAWNRPRASHQPPNISGHPPNGSK